MRGTLIQFVFLHNRARITPAHAGNTIGWFKNLFGIQDHPRPCGEHFSPLRKLSMSPGSPPPMRGTHFCPSHRLICVRITPAHAGNTKKMRTKDILYQDHPRPCGEHYDITSCVVFSSGSPPPMRGTLVLDMLYLRPARITPAHAGNTAFMLMLKLSAQDHPRPCGEHP